MIFLVDCKNQQKFRYVNLIFPHLHVIENVFSPETSSKY